jgi:hypothetical protein
VGRVKVLVADLQPPQAPTGSWWRRAASAVSGAVTAVVAGLFG